MLELLEHGELSSTEVLRLTVFFASMSVLVSSLEYLTLLRHFGSNGLFSGRVSYGFSPRVNQIAKRAFTPKNMAVIFITRTLAASWCLLFPATPLAIPLIVMLIGQAAIHCRCRYGLEGGDQMTMILLVMLVVPACFDNESIREIAIGFIAIQSCLSYMIAGIGKLNGAAWRDGTAVAGVLRTRQNGHEYLWRIVHRSPLVSFLATYLVIAFECTFSIAVCLSPKMALAYLFAGCIFHVTNAIAMGLNGFVWAFIGAYPAVLFWSIKFSQG